MGESELGSDCPGSLETMAGANNGACLCCGHVLDCVHEGNSDMFGNVNDEAEESCLELDRILPKDDEEDLGEGLIS